MMFLQHFSLGCPRGSVVKRLSANVGDAGLISGSGKFPGGGNGNLLQYSCWENSMDSGSWWATVHGVAKELDKTEWLSTQAVEFLMGSGAVIKIVICLISEPLAESLHPGWVMFTELSRAGDAVDTSTEHVRRGGEVQIKGWMGPETHWLALWFFRHWPPEPERRARGRMKVTRRVWGLLLMVPAWLLFPWADSPPGQRDIPPGDCAP